MENNEKETRVSKYSDTREDILKTTKTTKPTKIKVHDELGQSATVTIPIDLNEGVKTETISIERITDGKKPKKAQIYSKYQRRNILGLVLCVFGGAVLLTLLVILIIFLLNGSL